VDYQKIYNNLIESRLSKNITEDQYYEKHHIIPKCLGGYNNKENLVKLTYREHYIAHWLLCKIHSDHSGIQYAFLSMLRKQPTGERIFTGRMYDNIKRNFSSFRRWQSKQPGYQNPGKTQISRDSARKRMLERNPIKLDPSKNRTAQPIRVHFINGEVRDYSYAKLFCNENNVPYGTMKVWLKNNTGYSKKHNILKIERI